MSEARTRPDEVCSIALLPPRVALRQRVVAIVEAHDHLAVATERGDGCVVLVAPACLAAQLEELALELVRELGCRRVA